MAKLHSYLEETENMSSCYCLNQTAVSNWTARLESNANPADNSPLGWIRHLLVEDRKGRWTARQLLATIEAVSVDPEIKFAFSGQCCLEDLESAESVASSVEDVDETKSSQNYSKDASRTSVALITDDINKVHASPSRALQSPAGTEHWAPSINQEASTNNTTRTSRDIISPPKPSWQSDERMPGPRRPEWSHTEGGSNPFRPMKPETSYSSTEHFRNFTMRLSFVTKQDQQKFEELFKNAAGDELALSGDQGRMLLSRSKLPWETLGRIW